MRPLAAALAGEPPADHDLLALRTSFTLRQLGVRYAGEVGAVEALGHHALEAAVLRGHLQGEVALALETTGGVARFCPAQRQLVEAGLGRVRARARRAGGPGRRAAGGRRR